MTHEALEALAQRCEQATGPDLRLAREIAGAVGWRWAPNKGPGAGVRPVLWVEPDGTCHDDYPNFTASVDAALTLVPEGWERIQQEQARLADGSIRCWASVDSWPACPKRCATPALAIAAAALRARVREGE